MPSERESRKKVTILMIAIAFLLGASLLLGWYFRALERGAVSAVPVWDRVSANLNRLVLDDTVPDNLARELTIIASIAGCGCLAVSVFLEMGRRELFKSYKERADSKPVSADLGSLSQAQSQLLASILRDVVKIDLLRSPVLRVFLKAWVKSLLRSSIGAKGHAKAAEIRPLMNAAHGAAEWQNRRRKLSEFVAPLAQKQLEPA